MRSNNYYLYFIVSILFAGCYPKTRITGSWTNTSISKKFQVIFVSALTGNTVDRANLEREMAEAVSKRGAQAVKSLDVLPPGFFTDSVTKGSVMEMVKHHSADAILTISVQKKETQSRYVRGAYAPMNTWGYYNTFWGYYSHWSPMAYSPGYYQEEDVYYLETNLYDSADEKLIWSAQSRTYSYEGLAGTARDFAITVADRMASDGIFK